MSDRLERRAPQDLSAPERELYDAIAGGPRAAGPQHFALTDERGALTGPFNAFLVSPPVGTALTDLGAAVRYGTEMTTRVREIAILLVARHHGSAFETMAHTAVGRAAGLDDAVLQAISDEAPLPLTDDVEVAAAAVVRTLLADGDLDDAAYAAAVEALGERTLFELTALVGYYALLALQLRVFRAD